MDLANGPGQWVRPAVVPNVRARTTLSFKTTPWIGRRNEVPSTLAFPALLLLRPDCDTFGLLKFRGCGVATRTLSHGINHIAQP